MLFKQSLYLLKGEQHLIVVFTNLFINQSENFKFVYKTQIYIE